MKQSTKILMTMEYGTNGRVHPAGSNTIVMPDGTVQKVDPLEDSINGVVQCEAIKYWLQSFGMEREAYYPKVERSETLTIEDALKIRKSIQAAAPTVGWFTTGEHNNRSTEWILHNLKILAMSRNATYVVQNIVDRLKDQLGIEDAQVNVKQFSTEEEMHEYVQSKRNGVDKDASPSTPKRTLH